MKIESEPLKTREPIDRGTHCGTHSPRWKHPAALIAGSLILCATAWANHPNDINDDEDQLFALTRGAESSGVPVWAVSEPYINLWVFDQPLTYQTSTGERVGFAIVFKQRNSRSNSSIFGLGPSWECNWLSYVEYTTGDADESVELFAPLGGIRQYVVDSEIAEFKTRSTLIRLTDGGNFIGFQINYPTGAVDVYTDLFTDGSGNKYALLKQRINPIGQAITLDYETAGNIRRLIELTDYDGRTTEIRYTDGSNPSFITEVEDYYGRAAAFGYTSGQLTSITNAGNLATSISYTSGVITSFTTVYGAASFEMTEASYGDYDLGGNNAVNRSILITEPDQSKQLYLYRDQSTKLNSTSQTDLLPASYSSGEVPSTAIPNTPSLANTFDNSYLDARNSFHWNVKQYSGLNSTFKSTLDFDDLLVADYQIARRRHWLRGFNNEEVVTDTLSLEQAAGPDGSDWGQKVWYDYASKTNSYNWTRGTNSEPRFVALVLPEAGSPTRYTYMDHNTCGHCLKLITTWNGSSGIATRTNSFTYAANGIDMLTWTGPSGELISSNAYNGFHQATVRFDRDTNNPSLFTYDGNHRLTAAEWPTGLETTYTYYTSGTHIGWPEHIIDYDGATPLRTNLFLAYDKGLPTSVKDERGLTTARTWNNLLRLTSETTPLGAEEYAYDKLDLKGITDRLEKTHTFLYDSIRRLAHTIDPLSHTNSLGYANGLMTITTNALQQNVQFTHNYNLKRLTAQTEDASTTAFGYNLLGQQDEVTDQEDRSLTYTYNNQGLLSAVENDAGLQLSLKYDVRDRVIERIDANGVKVTITHDNAGRVISRTYPDDGMELFEYSPRGLITYTNQLGQVTRFGYDVLGRRAALALTNQPAINYTYNAAGDLRTVQDAKGQTTKFGYDQYGRLTSKTNAANDEILRLTYDANDRLTARWSPQKGQTSYGYDDAGNLTSINYPNSPDVTFEYDELNRLKSMKDGYSALWSPTNQTTWTYTSFGAVRTEDGPGDYDTITYDYRTNHLSAGFTIPWRNGATWQDWTQSQVYDSANRIDTITSPAGEFDYAYSDGVLQGTTSGSSLIETLTLPNTAVISRDYDSVARLAFTKLMSNSVALNLHSYTYNEGSQRDKQTRTDGSYVDYTYDDVGRLKTAYATESGGGTNRLNEQFVFGYDDAGNLTSRVKNALTNTFGVDSRNRLTSVTRSGAFTLAGNTAVAATNVTVNGSAAVRYADHTFVKDGLTLTNGVNSYTVIAQDSAGRTETNVVSANLPSTVSFTYDDNGNLTGDGLRSFEYDDEDRLVKVSVSGEWRTDFLYDGLGRLRVRYEYLWLDGAWALSAYVAYHYDGELVVQERWSGDEPSVNYTRGPDLSGTFQGAGGIGGLLARSQNVSAAANHQYYHADGNGNITALINEDRKISARYLYDPFGNVLARSGGMAEANTYRFSSKDAHDLSGLTHFGERFYDSSLQRFLNHDPIGEEGGLNLYAGLGNDPINAIDPWGMVTVVVPVEPPKLFIGFGPPMVPTLRTLPWDAWQAVASGLSVPALAEEDDAQFSQMRMRAEALDLANDETVQYYSTVARRGARVTHELLEFTPQNQFSEAFLGESLSGRKVGIKQRLLAAGTFLVPWLKAGKVARKVSPHNYRAAYLKADPGLPKNWQVHHSIPQKYRELFEAEGFSVDTLQFLRGVDPKVHSRITTEWARFDAFLGGNPSAADVARFMLAIERKYGDHMRVPGF